MKKLTKISLLLLISGLITTGCNTPNNDSNNNQSSNVTINLEHNITFVENENCTITLSKDKAKRDEKIKVTVSNITESYEVHKVTANGYVIDNYEFIMPNENVEVEVFLKQIVNGGNSENNETVKYNIKAEASEYAVISFENYYYAPGEVVEIEYTCKGSYVVDYFSVNGKKIDGTSFVMPHTNAIVSGYFFNVIDDTEWQVSCTASYMTANSFWYFNYGKDGLEINVKVKDKRICGPEFVIAGRDTVAYSDNIEIILDKKNSTKGYVADQTLKVLVDYAGNSQVRKASSSSAWGGLKSYSSLIYNATSEIKTLENKDGYNGYEVNIFVSYAMLNLDYASAVNNISACIAMRNTTTFGGNGSGWSCFDANMDVWNYCSNQPVILENNGLENR